MTTPEIRIDYLANHPAVADELANISWADWRECCRIQPDLWKKACSGLPG